MLNTGSPYVVSWPSEDIAFARSIPPAPINPTFMVFPSGSELAANPLELARDVVDDIAGLQVLGQHVPGIGLDLELARERVRLVKPERVLDRKACRPELPQAVEEHRNVKMGAPLARPRVPSPGVERVFQVEETSELAVLLFDRLR